MRGTAGRDSRASLRAGDESLPLARSQALARGLDLRPVPCAAEERLRHNLMTLWRLAMEAYYLHWYVVGKTWTRWTSNRHSLARIT